MNIQEQIKSKIDSAEDGTLFFVNDFPEYDNVYVSKLLSLMESFGVVVRLSKGIYYKPIKTKFGIVYPSTEAIVKTIAEHENAEILPTGEYALNALGLSTQVPMNSVFLTTGSSRTLNIGNKSIKLKRRVPSSYVYKSKLMSLLVLALRAKGQANIKENDISHITQLIQKSTELPLVKEDQTKAPAWIRKMLKPIINAY